MLCYPTTCQSTRASDKMLFQLTVEFLLATLRDAASIASLIAPGRAPCDGMDFWGQHSIMPADDWHGHSPVQNARHKAPL